MSATTDREKFDAIVIGSGIGGLAVAAILSKLNGKKVLVLEQHFTPGGFTHSFDRQGKFHWDVGLHYVGEMAKGSLGRRIFDYISNGKLKWQKMPDPFEKFVYPDFTFDVYSNPQTYQADLIKQFPHEKSSIKRYFKDVQTATLWFILYSLVELLPTWLEVQLKRLFRYFGALAQQTTAEYLDKNFQDTRLKALLVSQWGDYGVPPSQSCFGIHSLIVTHYFEGGWHPIGGGKAIAETIIPTIEQSGGKVITQHRVTEISIESGVAVGVKVQNLKRPNAETIAYYAPIIVSDAGAFNTYIKLIPESYPLIERESIQNFPKGDTVVTTYLGLKANPQQLGFHGENHWIYSSYEHESIDRDLFSSGKYHPQFAYLSFPSLKNPLAKGHTAEIIGAANYDFFAQWQDKSWKRRGADYNELKAQISNALVDLVENNYPGFRETIEYIELSTPLTIEHFDSSDRGSIYGIPGIPARLDLPWIAAKTPIKHLYLTGTDSFSSGVLGAMMGGVKTASLVDGWLGFVKIMVAIFRST